MRRFFPLFLVVAIGAGCDDEESPNPTPTVTEISGPITTSRSLSDTVRLTGDADIASGVEITITAGTVFEGAEDAALSVHGILFVDGSDGDEVTMAPMTGANGWGGIAVESGGVAELNYVEMTTAGITVDATGDLTITDSVISGYTGDQIVMNGGELTVSYSTLGSSGIPFPPSANEHGDLLINSSTGVHITYTNIIGAVYGMMIGGTNGAEIQFNNFLDNDYDVSSLGNNTAVDMRFNYWDSGAPILGSEFDVSSSASTQILIAGPRRYP